MNMHDDPTPELRAWLKEPVTLSEDGASEVADLVHDMPQQHGWFPPLPRGGFGRVLAFAGGTATGAVVVLLGVILLLAGATGPEPVGPGTGVTSPSPGASTSGPPDWPGVTFEPLAAACADGCAWATGGVWSVAAGVRGDYGSVEQVAFGPDGKPWFSGDGTIWQFGRSAHPTPGFLVDDLAVAPDGTVWVVGDLGLYSFDGSTWTERWSDGNLDQLDIAPDGTVVALGRGPDASADASFVVTLHPDGAADVDVVASLSPGLFPTGIVSTADGGLWVSAIASGYWPIDIGQSLLAHFDGESWQSAWPLGPDTSVAAGGLARAPDGSIWTTLSALPADGEWSTYLARHDGQAWTLLESEEGDVPYWTAPSIGPDGTIWLPGSDVAPDVSGGVVAFDGQDWIRFLSGETIQSLGAGPDGMALAATLPDFDEEGRLFAVRLPR